MILYLHFTQDEIIHYLIEAGYEVSREVVEDHSHIHGSRFQTTRRQEITASKGAHTGPIEKVFTQIIKNKLLTL